ncbi:MAG TPA: hypothetical protein PK156_48520, partial [Polyangium sp.]|nr:hypothetical protein [Polyangium sp.]
MDTYGYDYVYALTKDKVNELLAQNLASVNMPLDYTNKDSVTGAVTTIHVTLSPWSMANGSQNRLVKLNVPIKSGSLSITGLPGVNGEWDMTGVTMLIEVNLGWMGPEDTQELNGQGALTQLVFSPTKSPSVNDPGYVAIIDVIDPSKKLTTAAIGMLKQIAQEAFYENRANLQYIFASVVPTPTGTSTWLRPVKWQYYVASGSI